MAPPTAHRRKKLAVAAIAIVAGGAALFAVLAPPSYTPWTLNPADPRVTLVDVEREVSRRYQVADITASKLSRMISANEAVLFDVRTPAEYDAGHLPGAIRVEPGTTADAFAKLHADKLVGKPIVFYCAVGVRSSQLMTHISTVIAARTPAPVYNLRGGLFRWKAEGLSVVDGQGPGQVHPYDDNWGKLLARSAP